MLKSSEYFQKHFDAASKVSDAEIDKILIQLQNAVKHNHKVFICGNGGSALTASHYVTDWSKMLWSHKMKNCRHIVLMIILDCFQRMQMMLILTKFFLIF